MRNASGSHGFQLSPIKAIEIAASKIPGVISLAQGIPSFETPKVIKEFVCEKILQGLCDKYSLTTGLPELREEISLALAAEGTPYDPDNEIIVTAGSIEGISAALLASTEPGDEVLLPSPSYTSYQGAIRVARCTPQFVELDEDRNFDFHVEKIADAITRKTKVILFSSPNNPTGTLFSEGKTRALVDLALKHDITLLIDEVYKDFYYTDDPHFSAVKIPQARNHVIRVCSFSKAYAMTGWRVGFVHAAADRIRSILKYHDALVTCAPVASQYAAIAALRYGGPDLARFRAEFKERRNATIKALDELSDLLDYQVPKAAYFVFPRIKDRVPLARDSTKLAYDILEKSKVALVPGVAFGPSGESHLRITFGRSREDLQEGLSRLKEYFQSSDRAISRSFPDSTSRSPGRKVQRAIATTMLRFAAKLYLARCRPTIIGIAGSRGKTTVKRYIEELLSSSYKTRANILSYNTEVGLPLSILQLKSPGTFFERVLLPIRAIFRALVASRVEDILILEYGVRSEIDALRLLQIAIPDWLVVIDGTASDPSIAAHDFIEGIERLISVVGKNRIVWSGQDPWMVSQRENLESELKIDFDKDRPAELLVGVDRIHVEREILGQSAIFGVGAALLLARKLGVSERTVSGFCRPNKLK